MAISTERNTHLLANWKVILICLTMSLAVCQWSFDNATMAGFQAIVGFLEVFGHPDPTTPTGWNLDTRDQQLIASTLNIGIILGQCLTGVFASVFGRRPAIWLASCIAFVGIGIQIGATSISVLCVGRVLVGMSNAFFFTFTNIYCVEATPAHLRAVISSLFAVWVGIGAIVGTTLDNYAATWPGKQSYQTPLAALYAIPAVVSVLVVFIPESPRWLLVQNRPAEAEVALRKLRGDTLEAEAFAEELTEMTTGIAEEKALARSAAFWGLFRGTDLRRTIITIGVVLSRSASGANVFVGYMTYYFQIAGVDDPFKVSIYYCVSSLVGVFIGMYLMYKHFGRRSMMLTGTAAAGLCMFGAALADTIKPGSSESAKTMAGLVIVQAFMYSCFAVTLSWPLSSEIPSSRLRVLTVSLAQGIDSFFAWLIAFCTPYFINSTALNWGFKYMWIWAVSNAITFVFFYIMLPEVKGRSLEEIDELFQKRVSISDFPHYECVSSTRAHDMVMQEARKGENGTQIHVQVESVEKVVDA
ncbi:MFS transporter [Cercophora scortea]|uniref:MFS transporter n=1 Tax=Cercophora scortea TaxID=314031 RepID=A0AAE0I883_9PEZI|nr:MFS transporter [Cercophora scortea]